MGEMIAWSPNFGAICLHRCVPGQWELLHTRSVPQVCLMLMFRNIPPPPFTLPTPNQSSKHTTEIPGIPDLEHRTFLWEWPKAC